MIDDQTVELPVPTSLEFFNYMGEIVHPNNKSITIHNGGVSF